MPKFTSDTMRTECSCRGRCECYANISSEIKSLEARVDAFAEKMKAKLKQKYIEGWTGWDDKTLERGIDGRLFEKAVHTEGQEVDIANLAAMLWNMRQ